jgi:hypothetical protein
VLVVVITYLLLRFRMSIVAMCSPSVVEFCSAAMLCLLHWIGAGMLRFLLLEIGSPVSYCTYFVPEQLSITSICETLIISKMLMP